MEEIDKYLEISGDIAGRIELETEKDLLVRRAMEDKVIELADCFISESTTYRESKIACEKLLKQVSHEIELRALESKTRV